jgi:hypothetical protein
LERATAAFLTLRGQLPSTWCQQSSATLGKTTDKDPLLANSRQETRIEGEAKRVADSEAARPDQTINVQAEEPDTRLFLSRVRESQPHTRSPRE